MFGLRRPQTFWPDCFWGRNWGSFIHFKLEVTCLLHVCRPSTTPMLIKFALTHAPIRLCSHQSVRHIVINTGYTRKKKPPSLLASHQTAELFLRWTSISRTAEHPGRRPPAAKPLPLGWPWWKGSFPSWPYSSLSRQTVEARYGRPPPKRERLNASIILRICFRMWQRTGEPAAPLTHWPLKPSRASSAQLCISRPDSWCNKRSL